MTTTYFHLHALSELTSEKLKMKPKLKLHDYQQIAVDHLHRNPRAALFLDMGLGKTAITLSALRSEHLPVLVIAPKRVAENVWDSERKLWRPDLTLRVAAGSKTARSAAIRAEADITVIGRDNIRDLLDHPNRWQTVVLDELSGFKNRNTTRWKIAKKLLADTPHVWGLTGTPAPNGLLDLWPQIYLLDRGARLGTTLTGFRNRYFVAGQQLRTGVVTRWDMRPGADTRIHHLLEDICLSMSTADRIDLPPVTFNVVTVPLDNRTKKVYKEFKDNLVADLTMIGGEIHSAKNAAILSSKLSQISAGFLYVDDADLRGHKYDVLHSNKVSAVREIIDGTGSPVLVFYRFKAELEMLRNAIPEARLATEKGVIDDWNAGRVPVLLAHPASAGHGLNLQHGGHTIVWTSLTWSPEGWAQANKRLARQGQKHPVVIHMLISPGTVDRAIRARVQDKKSIEDALLEHLRSVL